MAKSPAYTTLLERMQTSHARRQKRFALLLGALFLLCNALVTAHAFGDVEHAVKDGCQICHQFERQDMAVDTPPLVIATPCRAVPVADVLVLRAAGVATHFQPRAPPFA